MPISFVTLQMMVLLNAVFFSSRSVLTPVFMFFMGAQFLALIPTFFATDFFRYHQWTHDITISFDLYVAFLIVVCAFTFLLHRTIFAGQYRKVITADFKDLYFISRSLIIICLVFMFLTACFKTFSIEEPKYFLMARSVIFYALALVSVPCWYKNVNRKSLSFALLCVFLILFFKDIGLQKRGATFNVMLLLLCGYVAFKQPKLKSALKFAFLGLVGIFGWVIYGANFRAAGLLDSSLLYGVENALTKLSGSWVASSYVFETGASSLSPMQYSFGQFVSLVAGPYPHEVLMYFYLPILDYGPWNSIHLIGGLLSDFGMIGGALFFCGAFIVFLFAELRFYKIQNLTSYVFYTIALSGALMSVLNANFFADIRFVCAFILILGLKLVFGLLKFNL